MQVILNFSRRCQNRRNECLSNTTPPPPFPSGNFPQGHSFGYDFSLIFKLMIYRFVLKPLNNTCTCTILLKINTYDETKTGNS